MMEKKTLEEKELDNLLLKLNRLRVDLGQTKRDFAIYVSIASRVLCDQLGIEVELRHTEAAGEKLN